MPPPGELWSFADFERYPDELVAAGLRPVWTQGDGYPGALPDDIAEWIDPKLGANARLIGPMSSMFWLAKMDNLVAAIHDPTCAMRDEIVDIPSNASIRSMLDLWVDSGKIPFDVYSRFLDKPQGDVVTLPVWDIPSTVTDSIASYNLGELFPFCRQQSLPQQLLCVRLRHEKKVARQARNIERDFTLPFGGNLLYRGLSRDALISSMALFLPVISRANADNEFGPGVYTTTSLEHALRYTGGQGALLVFQNPDFQALDVWEPNGAEWSIMTNYWIGRSVPNPFERAPTRWSTDVIRGAISQTGPGRRAPRLAGLDT